MGRRGRMLNDFRSQRDDLHEFFVAQFASDGTEDAGAAWVEFFINDDDGVAVESQVGAVVAADGLAGANDYGVNDFALLYSAIRGGFFDVGFDDVADPGVALVSAQDTDGCRSLGAGVVSHVEDGTNLEHGLVVLD